MLYRQWYPMVVVLITTSEHLPEDYKAEELRKLIKQDKWYQELFDNGKEPETVLQLLVESYIEEYGDTEDR